MSNNDAQKQALAQRDAFQFEPTSLISYQSAGKVIAVGDDDALAKCIELPATLDLGLISIASGNIQISGYLGAYVVGVTDQHGDQVGTRRRPQGTRPACQSLGGSYRQFVGAEGRW